MAAIFEAPTSHEATHASAHEWEWEHPEMHEWETHEWEHPEAHEWETHEWEHPEAHEWETHEWEHPEAHEWEHPEADPFFGRIKRRLLRAAAGLARRALPGAMRALGGMIPIPGVGAIAAPMLGSLTQRIVGEGEAMAAAAEAEAFGGSQGEAEVGSSETAHEAELSELLAAEAAAATSEAEAVSTIAATLPITI